ncbi:acetylcholinesterase-1 [Trichonephila inaurata madagascariensis]|uniref:acetylcholinesterase n=1 Tax=Trichonephila inaurata madagascariensis TaxID=2747483 RepID=A0A8X6WRL4_9ARAC|nr:acetylcholinesterase-1 [Trichonephila inaurata madagascariensis]
MGFLVVLFSLSILGCITCQTDNDDSDDYDYYGPDNLDDGAVTKTGRIISKTTEFYGVLTRAYLGIPYAKPPVGDLRFKKPEPIEPWSEPLVADTMPQACVQYTKTYVPWYDGDFSQSEDCLYMNIWAPRGAPLKRKYPVMFWIYGGGFTVGSNRLPSTNGQGLSLLGKSIVVAPNYRVGAMGFLTSGTAEAPGNMGIYDIIMALKWVKENIEALGGDPDNITIFGQGSGAITVSMFLMSPLTKGLFNRAIIQSGSFLSNKEDPKEYNLDLTQKLAVAVECASENQTIRDNPKEVMKCLNDVDPNELALSLSNFYPEVPKSFLPQYGDDFMPKNPIEYLKSGQFKDVDILIGTNKEEGSYLLATQYQDLLGVTGQKEVAITKSFGATILRKMFANLKDPEEIVQQYLGDLKENESDEVRKQVFTAMGDYHVTCPTMYFAENFNTGNNTVQFYLYDQRPTQTIWAPWMGVTHYDEVAMVFGRPIEGYNVETFQKYYTGEMGLSFGMSQMWGNFAKNGKALDMWKNFSKNHHQYLLFKYNVKKKMRGPGPHLDNCNFLRKYFDL